MILSATTDRDRDVRVPPPALVGVGDEEVNTVAIDLPQVHAQALDHTERIVAAISDDQLSRPTPCEGWDVATLLDHVVTGNLWVVPLVGGETIEQIGDRFDGDVLGDDFLAAYRASAAPAADAFEAPGAMDAPCAVSYGPVPGSVYCGHRLIDVLVHGWDLAVATDGDARLPDHLVEACLEVVRPQADLLRGSGAFTSDVEAPAHASPQTELLALLGRKG
jgi:uncharacterized protein (TIGR03086 family)